MVFLLEDDSHQAGDGDLNGGFIKLLGKNVRVQVVFIFNKSRPLLSFLAMTICGALKRTKSPSFMCWPMVFKDVKILGGVSA
jgi:hypothetical protein